jgi:poly(3-hydroxybutyrate) depolymerase
MISELQKSFSIDAARLYVAGQSMGGLGTFAMISEYPKLFAAGVPLCGGGDESKAARLMRTPHLGLFTAPGMNPFPSRARATSSPPLTKPAAARNTPSIPTSIISSG